MSPISFSEMDIHSMKRKELQALCKKHKIPANLTNIEMANRLESLLKEKEKPIAKGKSCIRSTGEEASENDSDHSKKLSKKVRFSPENETFEFLASELKPGERERRERARKRSMIRQVEGIQGIVTEDDVNKPLRETKSKINKVTTNRVKRSQKSVAFESVSMAETRVSTRTSKIKEVEKKEEVVDDGLLWKNQSKRTTRNRGMQMVNRASDSMENKGVIEDGVADVEVVRRGRKKRKQEQLVDDTNIIGTSSKTECELEVVLEIEEPLRRSSRFSNRRQSVVPKTENISTVKDKTKNNTLFQGGMPFKDNAKPKRSSSRLKSVAVSNEVVAEKVIKNKPGNRKKDLVFEKQNLVLVEGEREKNILKRRFSVEENATRKSSRRKSIVASDKNLAENVKKHKPTVGRKMDMISGEDEDDLMKGSSVVVELPRKSKRHDAKVKKALATDRTGEAVNSKILSRKSKEVHAQSLPLEESTAAVVSDSDHVMNNTGVLCDNLEDKDVFEETEGFVGVSGISGLEVVLNIKIGDEVAFQKNKDEADKDSVKAVDLAEDEPDRSASQVENLDGKKEMELLEDGESESESSGTVESQNDDEENQEEKEIEDDSGTNDLDSIELEVESKEDHLRIDQPDCLANPADNLELGIDFRTIQENKLENQASGFEIELDNYSQTERNEDDHFNEIKSNEDFNSNSFAVPESEGGTIQAIGVVPPDATPEKEGYPRSDQSVCLAKRDENIEIEELAMSETNDMGKHSDRKFTEEQHFLEPEIVLDNSYVEKSTPGQEKSIDRYEIGKLNDLSSGLSYNKVDVENSYARVEKHFVGLEDISDNSYGEKNTHILVHEDFEHNIEDCSALNKGVNAIEDSIENTTEGELKDSFVLHSSDMPGFTPSKTEQRKSDEFGNTVIVEPIDGEESANKFGFEDQLSQENASALKENIEILNEEEEKSSLLQTLDQNKITNFQLEVEQKEVNSIEDSIENTTEGELKDSFVLHSSDMPGFTPSKTEQRKSDEFESTVIVEPKDCEESAKKIGFEDQLSQEKASALKENIEIVNEEEKNSSLLYTSDQNKIMDFQLEVEQKDESELSFRKKIGEIVGTPSMTSRDETSNLKERKHSTQMSVSNEIKSLMMVDLDWTPSSNFRKVHTEIVEDQNKVTNENFSEEDCLSPFPHEDNVVADMPGGSFSLCENSEMEKPISSQEIQNSGEKNKKQNSGYCYSTEPGESEVTEKEFDTGFNTLNKGIETQPFEATSSQTFSGFAEDKGFDSVEIETQPLDATSAQTTSIIAEHQVDSGLVPEPKDKDVIDEELLDHTEFKDEDTHIIRSFDDGFADDLCLETNILTNSFASDSKSVQTITPSKVQEMTSDEAEDFAIVEPKDGDESAYKFDVKGHLAHDKKSILRENFDIVNEETREFSLVDTSAKKEITSFQVEVAQKDVDHLSLEHNISGSVRSPFLISRDTCLNIKAKHHSISAATPVSLSNEIQSLMMVDIDWTPSEFHIDLMPREDHTTSAISAVEDQNKIIIESISEADCHSTFFSENFVDVSKSGEQGGNQSVGYDPLTKPEDSERTEYGSENEIQPCSPASPLRTSGFAEYHANSSTNVDVSPTELRLLFDDETQCIETTPSSGALACKASASKSVQTTYLLKEANEGGNETVSLQSYDDTSREITSPEASDELVGAVAFEIVGKDTIAEENNEDVPTENRDGTSNNHEEGSPVQTEKIYEDLVNAGIEMEGDETQFDDRYGDEMEMVQEHVHTHKYDSSCYSAQFLDHEEAYAEEFGISQAILDSSNMFSSLEQYMFSEAESKISIPVGSKIQFTEEENNGFQSRVNEETEISAFITVETSCSGQTEIKQCEAAKVPDTVIEDESLKISDEAVHEETEDAAVEKQNLVDMVQCTEYLEELTEVETLSQDCTPSSAENADTVVSSSFNKDFANEDVEEKLKLVDVDGRDEKCKPSYLKTTLKTSNIKKQGSFIRGTPKKLPIKIDMKENATGIKREIMGSVAAKSTVKRRALTEL